MDVDAAGRAVRTLYPRVWHALHRIHPTDRSDVSPRDTEILVHLADGDGVSPGALAEHLGISPGTLSEALGSLEARGLLVRVRRDDDRRRVALSLTPTGQDAVAEGSGLDPDRLAQVLAGMTAADRARVVDGLGLLARAATALPEEAR